MKKRKAKPKVARAEPAARREALSIKCPRCGAPVDASCTDYNGRNKAFCKDRRPVPGARPDGAKDPRGDWDVEADRITAREKEAAGLFAEYVEPTTAQDLYWKWRFQKAAAGEHRGTLAYPANKGLYCIRLNAIERHAQALIGAETGARIAAHINATYPLDYRDGIWERLLCKGEPVCYDYRWEPAEDAPDRKLCAVKYVPDSPLVSKEEWDARFPKLDLWDGLKDAPEPDDGGLFDRTVGALGKAA